MCRCSAPPNGQSTRYGTEQFCRFQTRSGPRITRPTAGAASVRPRVSALPAWIPRAGRLATTSPPGPAMCRRSGRTMWARPHASARSQKRGNGSRSSQAATTPTTSGPMPCRKTCPRHSLAPRQANATRSWRPCKKCSVVPAAPLPGRTASPWASQPRAWASTSPWIARRSSLCYQRSLPTPMRSGSCRIGIK